VSNVDKANPWLWQNGRALARLVPIGLGVGLGVVLLAVVVVAIIGVPATRSQLAAESPVESPVESGVEPLETFAAIPPVAYLVQRIGGPYIHVEVLVQAGQDPHIFEPTPRQVIHLSQARLFFRVGMPFEDRLIEHIAGESAHFAIVNTVAGIALRVSSCTCEDTHCGHDHEDEDESPADPHVWLSPPLLKTMAAHVAAALRHADPRHEQVYQANLKTLLTELDALDHRIAQSLAPYRGEAFYVFHPAFGYFANTYGLRQESVEVEGKPPTPRQIFDLINKARDDHVKIIFLQPQFNQQIAASIAQAIGGTVIRMDSMAYDVLANLDDVAKKIAASNREKTE